MERGKIIRPKTMTLEEMEADVKATEEAARAEEAARLAAQEPVTPTPAEPKAEPPKEEPPKEEAPKVEQPKEEPAPKEDSGEVELLKAKIAEMDARNAELTKRVRDEDGRNGGKLAELQTNMTRLSDQLRQLMEENRELKKAKPVEPVIPEEPDDLETSYPEIAKGMRSRTRPAMDAATRAEKSAQEAIEIAKRLEQQNQQREYDAFLNSVKQGVPNLDAINENPEFRQWCLGEDLDTGEVRQSILNRCSQTMKAGPVIKLFQKWEKEKTPATAVPVEQPKGPAKPSKEAQSEVPKSAAQPATKAKPAVDPSKRLAEIEHKCFVLGTATAEDRLEYEKLLDARERGDFK